MGAGEYDLALTLGQTHVSLLLEPKGGRQPSAKVEGRMVKEPRAIVQVE